ncbi:unnamed protein product [marine sediment metagenome]|uniref:DUF4136 domain-containing protein n=1 Tax=marine sediment metagenome TaxID=412755 RepID=X0SZP0_9ZZZZ
MKNRNAPTPRMVPILCVLFILPIVSGCGAVRHQMISEKDYRFKTNTGVEVGAITNETDFEIDFDYQPIFKDAIVKELKKHRLLWTEDKEIKLVLGIKIVRYEKGSAFHRWILPTMGKTVLEVEGEYKEADSIVATCRALRTIEWGGGYTIGAWKSVFKDVAKDLVKDLRAKIPKS